jgi:hypothetical protein
MLSSKKTVTILPLPKSLFPFIESKEIFDGDYASQVSKHLESSKIFSTKYLVYLLLIII